MDGGLDLLDVRLLTVSGLMILVIKIRPRVEGQAKTALMAALAGPYQQPKMAIAVDDDIDASDLRQIMWSIATRVRADRDVMMMPNVKVWGLDNASPVIPGVEAFQRVGTKWMIDATKPAVTLPKERARFDKAMPPNCRLPSICATFCPETNRNRDRGDHHGIGLSCVPASDAEHSGRCCPRLGSGALGCRRGLSDAAGRLVVGFTAGGPTDLPARFIADKLSAMLGKPVIVENKPGAASMIAIRTISVAAARRLQPLSRAPISTRSIRSCTGRQATRFPTSCRCH